ARSLCSVPVGAASVLLAGRVDAVVEAAGVVVAAEADVAARAVSVAVAADLAGVGVVVADEGARGVGTREVVADDEGVELRLGHLALGAAGQTGGADVRALEVTRDGLRALEAEDRGGRGLRAEREGDALRAAAASPRRAGEVVVVPAVAVHA